MSELNKYIIDTGAICIVFQGTSPQNILESLLLFSATLKPELYVVHQPVISISNKDLVVCNIGDVEVRIYPCPYTITITEKSCYLSAPFDKKLYLKE